MLIDRPYAVCVRIHIVLVPWSDECVSTLPQVWVPAQAARDGPLAEALVRADGDLPDVLSQAQRPTPLQNRSGDFRDQHGSRSTTLGNPNPNSVQVTKRSAW